MHVEPNTGEKMGEAGRVWMVPHSKISMWHSCWTGFTSILNAVAEIQRIRNMQRPNEETSDALDLGPCKQKPIYCKYHQVISPPFNSLL